ncbi:craniofacial development protein 2-like [Saccostrea cucullata]|uniref:craniofacial development protein 2-like n=1 Tax=Saccostrea cuccullata TaxID=36930 RepID=UPI002ED27357
MSFRSYKNDITKGNPDRKPLVLQAWVRQEADYLLPGKNGNYRNKGHQRAINEVRVKRGPPNGGSKTTRGGSLREAQRPTRSLVTPKQTFTIGRWNVRTIYRGGASAQIAKEMEGYQLDILGISECRWTEAGKTRLASDQTVIYRGDKELYEGGVAIMISQHAMKALIEWTPISKRIMTARFYSSNRIVSLIQAYAPYNQKIEGEKDQFYQELQGLWMDVIRTTLLLLSLGTSTPRNIVPLKDKHKATWVSVTGTVKTQNDYLLISGQWRSSVLELMPTATTTW